jgi:peptidoglycan hydrolase-like protein with peptidoglycan-binding domain
MRLMPAKKIFTTCSIILALVSGGCEKVYYLLQREGAEEMKILGEALPLESNPKVAEVQKLLKLYGYAIGNIDGKIGPGTRNAILKFQKDNNLDETRFVDKATWEKLHQFEACGLVVDGEINVMAVQQALNNAGLNAGRVDGQLGPQTKRTLVAFQKSKGLKGDGIIGLQTLRLLAEHLDAPAEQE